MEGEVGKVKKGGEQRKDEISVEAEGSPSEEEIIMRLFWPDKLVCFILCNLDFFSLFCQNRIFLAFDLIISNFDHQFVASQTVH